MHDFFQITKWGRGKDSIRMLFNQVCCLVRLPLFHWKVEEISCHSSCAFCTGTLRTQRFPLEIKDDEMSKGGIGIRNVWTCWYFGKDTTIWNHWSCSIDTRLHRRKCEVLLSSWLCDPRSDVECAIGCNEGRTLQEGPGVFEVFCCCSAQRWETIFYLESGSKRASTQLFLVKVRFVFGLAKEVVFFFRVSSAHDMFIPWFGTFEFAKGGIIGGFDGIPIPTIPTKPSVDHLLLFFVGSSTTQWNIPRLVHKPFVLESL